MHPPSLYKGSMILKQTCMAANRPGGRPKIGWADSIKHDVNSVGIDTTDAAQMVLDRPRWKAFVSGLPTLESMM